MTNELSELTKKVYVPKKGNVKIPVDRPENLGWFDRENIDQEIEGIEKRIEEIQTIMRSNGVSIKRFKELFDKTGKKKYPARWFELEVRNLQLGRKIQNYEKLKHKIESHNEQN